MQLTRIVYTEKRNFGDRTFENGEYQLEIVLAEGENAEETARDMRTIVSDWLETAREGRELERRVGIEEARRMALSSKQYPAPDAGDDVPF